MKSLASAESGGSSLHDLNTPDGPGAGGVGVGAGVGAGVATGGPAAVGGGGVGEVGLEDPLQALVTSATSVTTNANGLVT